MENHLAQRGPVARGPWPVALPPKVGFISYEDFSREVLIETVRNMVVLSHELITLIYHDIPWPI